MNFLIDLLYLFAVAAFSPIALYRMIAHKRYRAGWANRFGFIEKKSPDKKSFWIHAVSVGEVNATRTIVAELKNRFKDFQIYISTTTDTGFARANALYSPELNVIHFPFDFSLVMKRAFNNIKPSVCLLMELEVWPNFIATAYKKNIPIVIANGRISDKSFSRYSKIKFFTNILFKKISLTLAQTAQYAERFKLIGCPEEKVIVTGSLKYDTAQITDKVEGADQLASKLQIEGQRLWVAGATGNDEEKIIIETFKTLKQNPDFSDLRLAIVPRKPERFDEVAQLIQQNNFPLIRFSQIKDQNQESTLDNQAVILGDTMGDLRKFYSLATIIFVGRTLVPMGGSDMAEAAALGKCTIFGPHAFNFRHTVEVLLKDKGAIEVKDRLELIDTLKKCLSNADYAKQIAHNGQEVIRKNQGATQKTIDQIAKILSS